MEEERADALEMEEEAPKALEEGAEPQGRQAVARIAQFAGRYGDNSTLSASFMPA